MRIIAAVLLLIAFSKLFIEPRCKYIMIKNAASVIIMSKLTVHHGSGSFDIFDVSGGFDGFDGFNSF